LSIVTEFPVGDKSHQLMRAATAAAAILMTVLLAGSAAAPPQLAVASRAPTLASRAQAIDAYLTGLMNAEGFRGAVLVARGPDIMLSKGYHLAVESTAAINTPHTRFRIGSVTKQFTAMAVLKLQELGKLNVTDRVCRYVTPCPAAWEQITIEHLLTHTSGLTNYPTVNDNTIWSPARLIGLFSDQPTSFRPGTRVRYSNSGYALLGYIIERTTGGTYADFLRGQILDPLGLFETGYDVDHPSSQTHATGYYDFGGSAPPISNVMNFYAAGAMFSSTTDLYRWNRFLLTGTPPIVAAGTLAQIFVPRMAINPAAPKTDWVGYGIVIRSYGPTGSLRYFHGGQVPGFVAFNEIRPQQQLSITVLSNMGNPIPNFGTIIKQIVTLAEP
jgi:CubicO group peptidase (beta-lactamase class C family)